MTWRANGKTTHGEVFITLASMVFEQVEEAGSDISYRCTNCRSCKSCKSHQDEMLSIKEEVEQDKINNSVEVIKENRTTMARLPLMNDPMM